MPFSIRVTVTEQDLDELRHVNNIVYVRWIQDVAFAHSVAVGLPMEKYRSLGAVFVVRRHEVDYLRSAVLGDELEVETRVTESSLVTAHRQTFIRRVSDGQLMVQARTHWAYVSTTTGRPVRIPLEVRQCFTIEPLEQKPTS
jgi:acyl-CoA thioester hydrolase